MADQLDQLKKVFEDVVAKDESAYIHHRERVKNAVDRDFDNYYATLNDHELLEYVLFSVIPRIDTKPIAHELLKAFGSLSAVLRCSPQELMKVSGIGESSARMLSAARILYLRAEESRLRDRIFITRPADAATLLYPRFFGLTNERIYIVSLDTSDRVIQIDLLAEGTVNSATVNIRKLLNLINRCGAAKVVIAHNHPAANLNPSDEDINATIRILAACHMAQVTFIDHMIFGPNEQFFSFMGNNLMDTVYANVNKFLNDENVKEQRARRLAPPGDIYVTKEITSAPLMEYEQQMLLLQNYKKIERIQSMLDDFLGDKKAQDQ